jgi:hypothetical protein
MDFASLAVGLMLIPVLGTAVVVWSVFRAGTPRWAPARVGPREGRRPTQIR